MASKCTKCGNTENYNFALNIGLCDVCIGERIEELEKVMQDVCNLINNNKAVSKWKIFNWLDKALNS